MVLRLIISFFGFILFLNQIHGQAYLDRHSTVQSDAWISNAKTNSPNAIRGNIHWIRYDLGETYSLQKSKIWNVNTPGILNAGAKTIIIDYSLDGTTWYEWGRYSLNQGTGTSFYEGQDGPDFSGLAARYLLINIKDNHGHATYAGLAEIKVDATPTTVSVEENQSLKGLEINASPNPFRNIAIVTLTNLPENLDLTYQLSDISGRLLTKEKVDGHPIEINGSDLVPGMYYFSVIHKTGIKTIPLEFIK